MVNIEQRDRHHKSMKKKDERDHPLADKGDESPTK
jgi:hypothetical protein